MANRRSSSSAACVAAWRMEVFSRRAPLRALAAPFSFSTRRATFSLRSLSMVERSSLPSATLSTCDFFFLSPQWRADRGRVGRTMLMRRQTMTIVPRQNGC
eukprot:2543721-Pleurochrysis_carterae.AAC.1